MSELMDKLQLLVNKLSREDLTTLNNMVITRIKALRSTQTQKEIIHYAMGMRVEVKMGNTWREGVIRKVNFKTIDVYVMSKGLEYRVYVGPNLRHKK